MNHTTGEYYYRIYSFFAEEHELILLDSEIRDIISVVNEFQQKEKEIFTKQDLTRLLFEFNIKYKIITAGDAANNIDEFLETRGIK